MGIARVSTSSHVPRHPVNARALRRGVAQLGDPPVDGFRHAAQLISVGLALLAEAPIGEPLVEGLRLKHLGSSFVCSVLGEVVCSSLGWRLGAPGQLKRTRWALPLCV